MAASTKRTASEAKKQANGHARRLSDVVHSVEKKLGEQVDLAARNPAEEKKGGYMLLIICVGGIYASL
jgi:UDP-galactose transporter B1